MKALVLEGYHRFSYKDVPDPVPGPDDVLISVKACAICGSDVQGQDGSTKRRIPPVIMGHEAAGVIKAVGQNVTLLSPGGQVTFDSTVYCGQCYFCRRGEINLCDNRQVLGVSCADYRKDGAMAELIAVPQHIVYPLPAGVSFAQAAMVEPLAIALHAAGRARIHLNDTAVVVGSGMIGLLLIQLLKAAGCGRVIAVDLQDEKLTLAAKLGADTGLNPEKVDVAAQVKALTDGRGADLAFEVVGLESSLQTALACVKKGASLVLVGNLAPVAGLPLQDVVTREITLFGSCSSAGEYPACLDLIAKKKIDVDAFISAQAPLAEGADWFRRLYAREAGLMKVILKP